MSSPAEWRPDRLAPLSRAWRLPLRALSMVLALMYLGVFWVAWPLGPEYVDEGGVTTLRMALSLLAMALMFSIIWVNALILDVLRRLEQLSRDIEKLRGPAAEKT